MKALRSVLVGIDYSEPSDNALREAARIAAWDGADLVALNVLDEHILDRARCEIDLPVDSVLAEAERRVARHVETVLGPGTPGCAAASSSGIRSRRWWRPPKRSTPT